MNPDARQRILSRVRAVTRGDPDTPAPEVVQRLHGHPTSPRPRIDRDWLARFRDNAQRLSTTFSSVADLNGVPLAVAGYLRDNRLPLQVVCWPALQRLAWAQCGVVAQARAVTADDAVGLTTAFCGIAETGTLMTLSGADTAPAASLLPETHIAVLYVAQIVPSMEEAWQRLRQHCDSEAFMPRAVNFISGPSRTADIEQTVTLGAHGPYRVHIVLVAE